MSPDPNPGKTGVMAQAWLRQQVFLRVSGLASLHSSLHSSKRKQREDGWLGRKAAEDALGPPRAHKVSTQVFKTKWKDNYSITKASFMTHSPCSAPRSSEYLGPRGCSPGRNSGSHMVYPLGETGPTSFLLWRSSALGTKSKFAQCPFAQSGSIIGLTKLLSSIDHVQPLAQAGASCRS